MDRFNSIYQQWRDSAENSYDTLPANPNLTPSQIDLLLAYAEGVGAHGKNIKEQIAAHSDLTPAQFQQLFKEYGFKDELTQNPYLTTDQIDLLYSTPGLDARILGVFSKLTEEQFNRFVNDDEMVREDAIYFLSQNPHLTAKQIDLLYNIFATSDDLPDGCGHLASYSKLTDEQVSLFLRDERLDELSDNPNLTTEQIDRLMAQTDIRGDYSFRVWRGIATHSKLTNQQVGKFLNRHLTEGGCFANDLRKNPNLTSEQVTMLFKPTQDELEGECDKPDFSLLARHANLTDDQWEFFDDDIKVVKRRDGKVLREVSNYLQELALNHSINPLAHSNRTGIINWMW
jgi:uncharacterized protein YneF (UPF0154 family)